MYQMQVPTPWGMSDYCEPVTKDIVFYSTPSHGGVKVSRALNKQVPEPLRLLSGWYEEDCEILRLCVTFPHLFPDISPDAAKKGLLMFYPELSDFLLTYQTKDTL